MGQIAIRPDSVSRWQAGLKCYYVVSTVDHVPWFKRSFDAEMKLYYRRQELLNLC